MEWQLRHTQELARTFPSCVFTRHSAVQAAKVALLKWRGGDEKHRRDGIMRTIAALELKCPCVV